MFLGSLFVGTSRAGIEVRGQEGSYVSFSSTLKIHLFNIYGASLYLPTNFSCAVIQDSKQDIKGPECQLTKIIVRRNTANM